MQHDPRAFLWDVRESSLAIQSFVADLNSSTYASNSMAQAACERKFEIIGEALNQLSKVDPVLASKISDLPQIIAFRNHFLHNRSVLAELGPLPSQRCPNLARRWQPDALWLR